MKKLYIKLRQSGEVKAVQNGSLDPIGLWVYVDEHEKYMRHIKLGIDCDLCDKDGRLWVAEQSDFTNIGAVITGSHDPKRISNDMLVWLKLAVDEYFRGLTNTPSEGKEEEK